nr:Chain E, Amyloid beta A4 protein [Homo sapiens]3U0T_F Chain F, Amyloid beta A4 protein [Homo sapiens]
AIIGLMVGGVV